MVGRISKLTPELQEQICNYIEHGNTFERACRLCNIGKTTFYRWKQVGKEAKSGKYKEFWEAIKRAEEKFVAYNVALIMKAADKQWQAAAWLLERKHYKEFGRKDQHELTGKDGAPIKIIFEKEFENV